MSPSEKPTITAAYTMAWLQELLLARDRDLEGYQIAAMALEADGTLRVTWQPGEAEGVVMSRAERYHCQECGWDGDRAELHEEPSLMGTWVERRCPQCGEEVYATVILRRGEEGPDARN
jgi:predicted RNA-binding Zn-ribbon protein involved in translation (DUF1610 family)